MKNRTSNWKKYAFEFLSIFIGISLAFALDNWNENRNERESERKILIEIKNGLQLDLNDAKGNAGGHKIGIRACNYFRKLINNEKVSIDSLETYNFILLRNFISIQNKSGYESLKSNGLQLVQNDSLRFQIISLYDFYYEILEKLEENYSEMQFFANHFQSISHMLSENMVFDANGRLINITQPLKLSNAEKNRFLNQLMSIKRNRDYVLQIYVEVEEKIIELIKNIDREIN